MVPFAEGAVTRLRREFKLLVDQSRLDALVARLTEAQGEVASPESTLPTVITSVYFDRPNHPLYRRALLTPEDCLKVRTKEYFPDLGCTGAPRVVFERKRERNGLTQKRRVWLARSDLAALLRGKREQVSLDSALIPRVAVTYRRRVFQRCEAWRVTMDDCITFRPISAELALGAAPLVPERMEQGFQDHRVVVEVKHLGAQLPDWLEQMQQGKARSFSKFAEGMTRLYGAVQGDEVQGG